MMNPIRIAPGPPTEEGWYWIKEKPAYSWGVVRVRKRFCGKLTTDYSPMCNTIEQLMNLFPQCQWSTRIPDPEE